MALLTTATEANRVVDTALSLTYARRKIYGSWTHTYAAQQITYNSAWEYIRRAVKSYKYVGLDDTTADSVAEALRSYYTRATKVSEWNGSNGSFEHNSAGSVPMADVVCQHEAGGMWTVTVSVNEEDTRTSLSPSESFSTLFYTEDRREYDDGETAPTEEE